MITLETTFVSSDGGFGSDPLTYRQVKRSAKVALYERSRNGKIKDYEVFFIKVEPKGKEQKFPNGTIKILEDDREKYATTSQWGRIAWSFGNLPTALDKFDKLEKEADPEEEEDSKELIIPLGEFTIGELAEKNKIPYPVACLFIKSRVEQKLINFVREERRQAKGKPSKIFSKA